MQPGFLGKGKSNIEHLAYLESLENALRKKLLDIHNAEYEALRNETTGLPSYGKVRDCFKMGPRLRIASREGRN